MVKLSKNRVLYLIWSALFISLILIISGCGGGGGGSTTAPAPSTTYGALKIYSAPPGANIVLDGTVTGRKTPYTFNQIAVGSHIVELSLSNYKTSNQNASVTTGGTAQIETVLDPDYALRNTPATQNPDVSKLNIAGNAPADLTIKALTSPSANELTALRTIDQELVNNCTLWDFPGLNNAYIKIAKQYNTFDRTKLFPGIKTPDMQFVSDKSKFNPDVINMFSCINGEFNAHAGYRYLQINSGLWLSLIELADLLILYGGDPTVMDYYTYKVIEANQSIPPKPFSVISTSLHDKIVSVPEAEDALTKLVLLAFLTALGHELGHATLGHILEGLRNKVTGQQINEVALSNQAEVQADIFSGELLFDPTDNEPNDPDFRYGYLFFFHIFNTLKSPACILGDLLFYTGNTTSVYLCKHPDPKIREAIYEQIYNGEDMRLSLNPLFDVGQVARTSSKIRQGKMPMRFPIPTGQEIQKAIEKLK